MRVCNFGAVGKARQFRLSFSSLAGLDKPGGQSKKSAFDLNAVKDDRTARYYLQEQTILHLLARKEHSKVRPLINEIVEQNEARMAPVRIIAARHFLSVGMADYAQEIAKILRYLYRGPTTEPD